MLELSGIDTSVFKAHSTRETSVSKASTLGASVSGILKRAYWSQESTFQKIYNKKKQWKESDAFQTAVINSYKHYYSRVEISWNEIAPAVLKL